MEFKTYTKDMTKEEIEKLRSSPEIENEVNKLLEVIKKSVEENSNKR